jgi:predicted dehydrogenase
VTAEPRVGVIGAGGLGVHHVRILNEMEGARFAGFYDASPDRAAQVSRELGVRAFDDLESLLGACDALTVVVPTPAHFDVARMALERGKHLLIEKPITETLDQADALLELAERAGVVVQTGHVERFNRAVRAALPYVDAPRFIESDRLAPFNPRGSDVAVVLDLMIHDIDLVRTLVGAPVAEVHAVGVPVLTPTVDIANARLAFASGAVANITASRVSRERLRKVRIFQQSGYLSLDLATGTGEFFRMRGDVDVVALARAPLDLAALVERVPMEAPEGEPLRLEFASWLAAVRGEQDVAVTAADGREALEVAQRIVREIERTLPSLTGRAAYTAGPPR